MAWPPTPDEFYLDAAPARPVFQGDIFADVPFVKVKGGGNADSDPNLACERRFVAAALHPCDMYGDGGRVLIRVQAVALVYKAEGINIPAQWDGAFSVCPLPDLLGDGDMWVADFARVANVDRTYLPTDRRVRVLSHLGWRVFRQRHALSITRGMITLGDLERIGRDTWQETLLETDWITAGRDGPSFHDWLDSADPELGGMTRRRALTQGMLELVRAALARELAPQDN